MTAQLADLANLFTGSDGFYAVESATTNVARAPDVPEGRTCGAAGPMALSVPTSLTATITRTLRDVGAGRFLPDGTGVGG
jgi:hypothetical protein